MSVKRPLHARIYWKIPLKIHVSVLKIGHIKVFCTTEHCIFLLKAKLPHHLCLCREMGQFSVIFKIIAVERRKQENNRGNRDKEVTTSNSTRMRLLCILALRKDRVALGSPHMHMQDRYHIIDRTINSTKEITPVRVLGQKSALDFCEHQVSDQSSQNIRVKVCYSQFQTWKRIPVLTR